VSRGSQVVTAAAILATLATGGSAHPMRVHAGDARGVDLALVAVAAAHQWALGNGAPPPRAWVAARILRACQRVERDHRIGVTSGHHARASAAMDAIVDALDGAPAESRAAVLCALLLDLLNDRREPAFAAVSRELARLDTELARGEGAEVIAARAADSVREAFAREVTT
jgi:hypothetical protein